ncbi:type III PLP-dependent enzyme domain-containing protein [Mycobacterium dioxanotrophicus]|uniref:LysA protein n=1 Tax=Mycobacterium dioxanotrophicus TaxID=482462 RepID=UPI001E521EDA|nr:LysA protein [Mycobacterium dioxanotrophicus]
MTLSTVVKSMFSARMPASVARRHSATLPSTEPEAVRGCASTQRSLGTVELALPASALADSAVARWARDCGVTVGVRTSRELGIALAADIAPIRMTVHAGGLNADELLFCTVNLGVGRIVVDSLDQIEQLASAKGRRQRVLVAVTRRGTGVGFGFDTHEATDAYSAVLSCPRLDLVGLYSEVGPDEHHFVSHPAAIGDMLAEMTQIRRDHGVVLTRIGLGGHGFTFGDGVGGLADVATSVDETLDDACATLRFPRPVVTVLAEPANRMPLAS